MATFYLHGTSHFASCRTGQYLPASEYGAEIGKRLGVMVCRRCGVQMLKADGVFAVWETAADGSERISAILRREPLKTFATRRGAEAFALKFRAEFPGSLTHVDTVVTR